MPINNYKPIIRREAVVTLHGPGPLQECVARHYEAGAVKVSLESRATKERWSVEVLYYVKESSR